VAQEGSVPPTAGAGFGEPVPLAPSAPAQPAPPALDAREEQALPAAAAGSAQRRGRLGWADPVVWLIALATFAAYSTISVFRYLRLDPGSWDLGIYTEYVRQFAHLQAPVVPIRGAGFNLLGDHFQPIVALIGPFFRLFPTPVTLLVAQALLTALSVVPVCRAAQERLGTGTGRAIGAAYGFSWGLQQMIVFDFHEIAFAVPLLAFSLSALVRRHPRAAALWALPLVLVKEDQGLTVAAIGLVMMAAAASAWAPRSRPGAAAALDTRPARVALADIGSGPGAATWAWAGGLLVLWGVAGSVLAIAVIIPHFNPAHLYPYWNDGGVITPHGGHLSASGVLAQLTAHGTAKLRTTALVLLPVLFVALRSPVAAVALPGLALRFLSTNSSFWGIQWHYSATLMPVVFLAAVDGLARFQAGSAARAARAARDQPDRARGRRPPAAAPVARNAAIAMLALAGGLAFRFPLAELWNAQTYQISPHVRAENAAMAHVPAGTTVEATLTLLAPLATRDTTYWIGTAGNPVPRYIVFDARYSGYSPVPTDLLGFLDQRYAGVTYRTVFESDGVYVFRRSAPAGG